MGSVVSHQESPSAPPLSGHYVAQPHSLTPERTMATLPSGLEVT